MRKRRRKKICCVLRCIVKLFLFFYPELFLAVFTRFLICPEATYCTSLDFVFLQCRELAMSHNYCSVLSATLT